MRFSVITVCYNAAATIGRTLESVAAQVEFNGDRFADFEYLVVDGGSTDATLAMVEEWRSKIAVPVRATSESDLGIYDAMNRGLARASGDYCVFLNADDYLEPMGLAALSAALGGAASGSSAAQVPRTAAHSTEPTFIAGPAILQPSGRVAPVLTAELVSLHPGNLPVCHQATAIRTSVARELGGFDTRFRIAADYDLFLRAHSIGATWALTDTPVVNFSEGGASGDYAALSREYRDVQREAGQPGWLVALRYARHMVRARFGI